MADNVTANAGTGGATFATDDIAGVHYPITKLAHGALDAATLVSTASPLPVGDAGATLSVDDGAGSLTVDNAALAVTGGGVEATALRVTLASDSTGVLSVDDNGGALTVDGTVTVQDGGGAITVDGTVTAANTAGDAAHDAADTGNPLKLGGKALTADPTAVATGDRTNALFDVLGKQVVHVGALNENTLSGTATYTTTTAADVIAAQGAGVKIAVTSVLVTNAHATVGTKVEIRDGTTVKLQGHAAAAGGGFSLNAGGRPLFLSTANTAVTARCVTTGADVDVSISGYKTAV